MRFADIDYIYGRLKNQKMTEPIRPGDTDEAYYQCGWNNALCRIDMILAGTPTLDVEPVRHGRWIERSDKDIISMTHPYICNLCGRVEMMKEPYCNCGAKMDLPN